jgi:hypothetical protein
MRMSSFHAYRGGGRLERTSSHLQGWRKSGGGCNDGLHSVSMCGELLSHIFGHLDIHLWGSEKGSDVLSTIGMAGSDYWTQLRRGA